MRRRPGGTFEVMVTLSRSAGGGVAQGAGEAAGGGGLVGAGVAGAGDRPGRVLRPKTSRAASLGVAAHGLLVLALFGGAGREGGRRRGEVVATTASASLLDGVGDGVGEVGGDR